VRQGLAKVLQQVKGKKRRRIRSLPPVQMIWVNTAKVKMCYNADERVVKGLLFTLRQPTGKCQ